MNIESGIHKRTELLLGRKFMSTISSLKVIVFGVGGVGGWCAESLVRSGVVNITIVDSDRICITNVNRQVMATIKTVGEVKVEALKTRLLEINPVANINALQKIYSAENADEFHLEKYDYIIDAIDSLSNKVDLINRATKYNAVFFSSMGAALKIDPAKIKVAEFWKVSGCPLAAIIRKKMKSQKCFPYKKFLSVYSDEVLENKGANNTCGLTACMCPKSISSTSMGNPALVDHEWCSTKARINGTSSHITAIFGFTLAGLVIEDINKKLYLQ